MNRLGIHFALLALAVLLGCSTSETPPAENAPDAAGESSGGAAAPWQTPDGWEAYGASVTLPGATPIADLNATPTSFIDKVVRVEGTVVGVCKGMGCWVEVKATDGSTIIARSTDHSVTVPMDCEERMVTVQGKFLNMGAPTEEVEKHAEEHHADGGADGHDAEAHVCPSPLYMLSMDAVELEPAAEAAPADAG